MNNSMVRGMRTYPPKQYLDDTSSQTSSTITYKLTRKQDQRSSSRRSLSRNSSDNSLEFINLSRFYIKMNSNTQNNTPILQTPVRRNIMNRIDEPVKQKKRSPTPAHSRNKPKNNQDTKICKQKLQTDLLIAQLETKYNQQKSQKQSLQKRLTVVQREIKIKLCRIKQLQTKLTEIEQREKLSSKKCKQYEEVIKINETNLNDARNNLQKLKNTIKQNRYAQIQSDNSRLRSQNKQFRQQIQYLMCELKNKNMQLSSVNNELLIVRNLNQDLLKQYRIQQKNRQIQQLKQTIRSSKTSKQQQLQRYMYRYIQQKSRLQLKNQKLQIKINFINRKKINEMDMLRQNKNQIINKLRNKIHSLCLQLNNIREQNQKLKNKNIGVNKYDRKNNFFYQNQNKDQIIQFQLSP